jgi:alanyl-tRNA synthetase
MLKRTMTDRLYYHDSFLYNFDAEVRSVIETPRPALILDRTAFYPTSGGQIHDTGWIVSPELANSASPKWPIPRV